MNYVDHFNLFGIDAKQIPCDTGEGAPTTTTVGAVGCFYMDTLTGDVYKCVSVNGGVYGWELFGSGSPDAVKYTSQELTEEQKAQARENIGAAGEGEVNVDVVKTELQSEIAVERARITNLATLTEGSTTGDAELADIRVGYDGTTYASAGEAVREQASALNDIVGNIGARVFNIDGYYEVAFEQGGFDNTGVEANSNYTIRSKEYIPRSLVKNISVNDGLNYRVLDYDDDLNFRGYSAWNSLNSGGTTGTLIRITVSSASEKITPDTDHGFVLTTTDVSVNDRIHDLETKMDLSQTIIEMEQGSLAFVGGGENDAANYIRNRGYIPYDTIYKLTTNQGYSAYVFYYDRYKTLIKYDTLNVGFGSYKIPYVENAKWIRFDIQNEGKTTITPNDNTGACAHGLSLYREEHNRDGVNRNFLKQIKHQIPIATACLGKTIEFYDTNFGMVCMADLHGKFRSMDDSHELYEFLRKYSSLIDTAIINAGDAINGRIKENGAIASEYTDYINKAMAYKIYHTIGQHEVGYFNTTEGRSKTNCLTHDEVFEKFIHPMKDVWNLPDLSTVYYYKDFTASKIRLISLYQYNVPLVEESSTTWKYMRSVVWYGQEQLDWLASTLNTTPSDYGVIILMHQPDHSIVNTENTNFFHGDVVSPGNYIISGTPIIDIVEAYRNRAVLNKTYTCKDTIAYPASEFSNTVNIDFSNAGGFFINYYTGDAHVDYVGSVDGTTQKNIGVTSNGQSYDIPLLDHPGVGTAASVGNNPESELLTVVGYDFKNSLIRIGRLGQQYASDGKTRTYTAIKY
jgi:hypothetical protein